MMAGRIQSYIHGTAPSEQERLALLNRLSNAPFLAFLGGADGQSVLEVGSGLGILTGDLAERNPSGITIGLEYSPNQLRAALGKATSALFVGGDAHSLPFPDHTFDLVYCRYLLEHAPRPLNVLREMRRVLKPGGRAAVQENNILINQFYPDCLAFDRVWARFAALQSELGGDALIGKKLFQLFTAAGFQQIDLSIQPEVHWFGSPGYSAWLQNLIGNIHSAESEMQQRGLATREEIDAAAREVEDLIHREDGSAYFYWNRAVGYR